MYNRRYYENGGDTMQPDSSGQGIMQAAPQDMQQAMPQPQSADQGQGQQQIKDPNHALQIIIQMLIAQGIPPEQAKQIALEMIKAVAEGGVQELASDEKIHARFGGHITRQHYLFGGLGKTLGNIVGGIGSAAKGVVNAVKSVASSGLGKAALTAAAIYFGGPMLAGALEGTTAGSALFGVPMFGSEAATAGILGSGGAFGPMSGSLLGPITQAFNQSSIGGLLGGITGGSGSGILGSLGSNLIPAALGFGAGALSGQPPQQNPGESNADYQKRLSEWNSIYKSGLTNPTLSSANNPSSLYPNNPFYSQRRPTDIGVNRGYASGGRIGYAGGGIGDIIGQVTKQAFFQKPMMAEGGRMNYGLGSFISGSGVAEPVSGGSTSGGSGFGGLLGRLIEQHPDLFKKVTQTTANSIRGMNNSSSSSDSSNFIDVNGDGIDDRMQAAYGGRIGYKQGNIPTGEPRQNQHGINEIDYRRKGGYVPPIGIKEKADDIPAMLSNNEFVFTADAVRNAGHGDVNKGAKRMYRLMKHLEAGGIA
jgi:hypothetical protein